jgi:hypothetical protein
MFSKFDYLNEANANLNISIFRCRNISIAARSFVLLNNHFEHHLATKNLFPKDWNQLNGNLFINVQLGPRQLPVVCVCIINSSLPPWQT